MRLLRAVLLAIAIAVAVAALPAEAIPRDVVIARAKVWVNYVRSRDAQGHPIAYGVPYSQKRWAKADGTLISSSIPADQARYLGWRTDCSGFVAMCWDLHDYYGRPQSPTTSNYAANPSRWYRITKARLASGDMMLVCAEWGAPYSHAVLFGGWADATHTLYWAYEEASSKGGTVKRLTPYPYWGTAAKYYRPYRYAGIQYDFADVITRIEGSDAYKGAVAAARVSFPTTFTGSVPGLVVASAEEWSNALGSASVAGAVRGPVLLTARRSLPAATSAEIRRLKPAKVYILGGPSVVSSDVATSIGSLGTRVVRIQGHDRYAMAAKLATFGASAAANRGMKVDTAYLVSGLDYPDAFALGPITVRTSRPVLLASTHTLPPVTLRTLRELGILNVVVGGDTSVIGSDVEALLLQKGFAVRRISAVGHYALSRAIAAEGSRLGLSWSSVGVTSDLKFSDSLTGGIAQGFRGSSLLLTPQQSLDTGVGAEISARRAMARPARAYGGYTSLAYVVRRAIASRLRQP